MTQTPIEHQINSLEQDTVYALAACGGTLFAGRASGLCCSTDDGQSWQDVSGSLAQEQLLAITALIAADNTLFAGTFGAVLRSEDFGATWQAMGLASPPPHVVALAASPNYADDGVVVVGTALDGIFVSTDWGQSWVGWNFGLIDLHIYALAISPNFAVDHLIFAGTQSGVFYSHNGGRTWRETPFPIECAPVSSLGMSPTYASDGVIYAGSESSGLFVSEDSGANWQKINGESTTEAVQAIQVGASQLIVLLEGQLISSHDHGVTWKQYPFPSGQMAMTLLPHTTEWDAALVGFANGEISHTHLT